MYSFLRTESSFQDFTVHNGAGLSVDHSMRDGLMLLPEFPLTLRGLDGGGPPHRVNGLALRP